MQPDPNQYPVVGRDHQLPASTEKPKHTGVRVFVWILLLAIFGAAFFLILHKHDEKKPAPTGRRGAAGGTAVVTSATAQKGDIGVYLDAIGTATPVYTAAITAQVTGVITEVHYAEGQTVSKGDPLIDIDPRPYQASLLEAQGLLERDQGILAQAQMDLARYQAAWAQNAIPKQTLDDQEKIVQTDQGTVKNDQGTVQYDQVQLSFCHIASPITGRVGLRLVDPGNLVSAGATTPLVVVTQIQPITVVFTIAEDSLGQVQPRLRQRAKLEVDAYDHTGLKKIATGSLITLDNQIDTTTGTVKARASFANKDSSLFPNQFVNTRLLVNTLKAATLIPTAAIQHNGQAAYVYVLLNNVAHLKPIKVGVTDGDTSQVTGINPGDVLATSNFDKLQEGAAVSLAGSSGRGARAGSSGSSAP